MNQNSQQKSGNGTDLLTKAVNKNSIIGVFIFIILIQLGMIVWLIKDKSAMVSTYNTVIFGLVQKVDQTKDKIEKITVVDSLQNK